MGLAHTKTTARKSFGAKTWNAGFGICLDAGHSFSIFHFVVIEQARKKLCQIRQTDDVLVILNP